uniref:iridoid oxidase-like n=1 Tax=Erigeron canadensis TaxID=72917 RepID=UPI001CB8B901|nr:iridoid oxidase-like [Erigeron canadensis]
MEYYQLIGFNILLVLWVYWAIQRRRRYLSSKARSLPPGPTPWPVVGNIFQLGFVKIPHESFAQLARVHGPHVMTLWLGSMCTVVISSNEAAREMFKNHDMDLAGRKVYECMKGDYGDEVGSMITAQYGPNWRLLRKLSTTEFFLNSRLDATSSIRTRCIDKLVQSIQDASGNGANQIDVGRFFFLMAFNLIGNLMFSRDLLDSKSKKGAEFFYHAGKVMEYAGKPNVADFMPFLRWLDPQGIRKNMQNHIREAFRIAGGFIKERLDEESVDKRNKDYLDVLLEYRGDGIEGPSKFSSTSINIIVFEMFTAGTDTTTSTLEWAMAELLHNPHIYKKLQAELQTTIRHDEKIEEKHIDRLPYLKAVIKETLRLHPPLPFLVPHKAMQSCEMLGFTIPKETQVLVNVWAIGRDPKTWKDPSKFDPDRFLEHNYKMLDYKGQHFEFIPFGSGRRMCPAIPLASRVLPMALGTLLHKFEWVLGDGVNAKDMDMNERIGITLRKAVPLMAIPVPYY